MAKLFCQVPIGKTMASERTHLLSTGRRSTSDSNTTAAGASTSREQGSLLRLDGIERIEYDDVDGPSSNNESWYGWPTTKVNNNIPNNDSIRFRSHDENYDNIVEDDHPHDRPIHPNHWSSRDHHHHHQPRSKGFVIGMVCLSVLAAAFTTVWHLMEYSVWHNHDQTQGNNKNGMTLFSSMTLTSDRIYWDRMIYSSQRSIYDLQPTTNQQQQQQPILVRKSHHHKKNKKGHDDDDDLGAMIYLNHTEAFQMIHATKQDDDDGGKKHSVPPLASTANDFFKYQQGWEVQITQAYCGVAASAAVMNSLRGIITLPQDEIYIPYPWATQREILVHNDCVTEQVFNGVINDGQNSPTGERHIYGLGIDMVGRLLSCHLQPQGFSVQVVHVDPQYMTVDDIRLMVAHALAEPNSRVIMNYDRGGIGQGPFGHGHFSPIGAYHAKKDSFLVMDVAKYKYPPVWISAQRLFDGISTWDRCVDFQYAEIAPPVETEEEFEAFIQTLNCVENYRGLIIISPTDAAESKKLQLVEGTK